jgi:serine/threonine-protein kinase
MRTPKPLQPIAARWPEIEALLDEALALPAPQRPGWIDGLSQRAPDLRDTLAELLRGHAQAETDDFLATLPPLGPAAAPAEAAAAPAEAAAAPAEEEYPGQRVGPWRLLSPLGRGGMGSVWLAERADGAFKRQVALKLPRRGWDDTLAQRMARERDILAALEHPHIARLYEASTDEQGRPYLAMEFVQGQPIDAWCEDKALTVCERLPLLLQVAQAVSHAHARLVVHRDLKPANILVTEQGQVRLLDFGIAKLLQDDETQETALTQLSGRAMTLDYASPEQIRGDPLTTASDLYSLGVVAFELLAGVRPYRLKRGTAAELEEAIAEAEPPLASAVSADNGRRKALQGDLDAILHKTLKKDPAARYASVTAFAEDIERHLRGLPVKAQPDSRRYRSLKFLRRHRLGVAAGAAVLASLVAGNAVALWQAQQASVQAERALNEANAAEAVSGLYTEALTQIASTAQRDATALGAPHAVSKLLLDKLNAAEARYKDRPYQWQAMLRATAQQLDYQSDFEASLAVGRRYMASLQQHGAPADVVIGAHMGLGHTLFSLGRFDEAEAVRRAGVQWAPGAVDERTDTRRIALMGELGDLLLRRAKFAEARAVLERAAALAAERRPRHPERAYVLVVLSSANMPSDPARGLALAQEALAVDRELGIGNLDDRSILYNALGQAYIFNAREA